MLYWRLAYAASLPSGAAHRAFGLAVGDGVLGFVVEVGAKMRLVARACDLEGNLRTSSVLRKKRIDGFEQDGLPPCRHLRELRIHLQSPMEVEGISVEAVLALQICICPGHLEV